ncbi:transcriptional regulator, GntR family [Austwickia chelonae]|uniref:Putative GntR family transcriptional regulator n=1 Tax=Austwickia chelonae NBRC 105200 TaxID=1184607 RepID=K6V8P6_9MICO|nr:FCD domain-containing protein [Austwickia chelonae]GAB78588.1 putative GntR family transcriptional regulator [Austwickia chelonae NBRC 105200]SEW33955.1 transcriptional regulator, GntR family [Austwickia chelonae]
MLPVTPPGAGVGLHEWVLGHLGAAVAAGEIPEGTILRIEELEARYEVSRTVAREAVKVLESMSLLESRRRVGIRVLPRARWNVYDPRLIRWRLDGPGRMDQLMSISQLRRGLEPLAARLAALHATEEQARALSSAAAGMAMTARIPDLLAYLEYDILFHETLLQASGNEMLVALAPVVREVLAGRTHHHLMPEHPENEAVRLHGRIATAVANGDADTAESAMRTVVDEAQTAMVQIAADEDAGSVDGRARCL